MLYWFIQTEVIDRLDGLTPPDLEFLIRQLSNIAPHKGEVVTTKTINNYKM